MSNVPQRYEFVLPHGQSRVTNVRDFITNYIAHQVVDTERVGIYIPTEPPQVFTDPLSPIAGKYEVKEHKITDKRNLEKYCIDRFMTFLSKKPIEFNVGNLTIENLEELSIKYLDKFGSDRSIIIIQHLNKYLKLVAIIDEEAFKIYRNETSSKGELVELHPDKWVVGKFQTEIEMFRKLHENTRYSF